MHSTLEFLVNHGYLMLLIWVFLEQAGLPLPSIPLLLAAGALGGMHRLNFGIALLLCMIASVAADTVWYQLGKKRGIRILHWLCRISLEPDSCVRRTEGLFEKQGAKSLLIAKFLPGLNTVATPLAGIFNMKLRRFLAFDALGAILWAGTYLGLGYIFAGQIELIALNAQQVGGGLMVLLGVALGLYISYKFVARQK